MLCGKGAKSATPPVNATEQEQPDDINKVPVPGRSFKTKVMFWREVTFVGPHQADRQEDGAD